MSRALVITADDLGREPSTTDEIVRLATDGLITATTLIPVSPQAVDAAVRIAATAITPRLHLTLTSETGLPAWRPLGDEVASLVTEDGTLPYDPFVVGGRGETEDVLSELDAQLYWCQEQGLAVVAADSHAGTLYGLHGRSWLEPTLRWCGEHGLAFRLPRDPEPYFGGPLPEPMRTAHAMAVELAAALDVRLPQTMVTNRRTAKDLGDYAALREQTLAQLAALPEGVSELFLHPTGAGTASGDPVRVWETRLLRDPVFAEALEREQIRLMTGW